MPKSLLFLGIRNSICHQYQSIRFHIPQIWIGQKLELGKVPKVEPSSTSWIRLTRKCKLYRRYNNRDVLDRLPLSNTIAYICHRRKRMTSLFYSKIFTFPFHIVSVKSVNIAIKIIPFPIQLLRLFRKCTIHIVFFHIIAKREFRFHFIPLVIIRHIDKREQMGHFIPLVKVKLSSRKTREMVGGQKNFVYILTSFEMLSTCSLCFFIRWNILTKLEYNWSKRYSLLNTRMSQIFIDFEVRKSASQVPIT